MTHHSSNHNRPAPPQYADGHVQHHVPPAPQTIALQQAGYITQADAQPTPPQATPEFIKVKKRSGRFVRLLQMIMSLVFFGTVTMAGFVLYSRYQLDKPGPLKKDIIFEVGKGQGLSTIAERLKKQGVIRNSKLFRLNPATIKVATKLKAGKFAIPKRASMQQVLDILVRGRAIFYKVTIPEGLTSQQVVNILNQHPQLSGNITSIPPEGSLMPDTYQFDAGADRTDILKKMTKMQTDYLAKAWARRQKDLPLKSPQEALILASIVEKETGISSERKRVAGIFINRLKKGMKLQSDPTIIYGLVKGQGKLGHPLRQSEMKKKTGYNTYHISGLPPTPIANPGRQAIDAVLNPARSNDLYFVADGSGGHAFASTLKQHNANVRNWRKIEAQRRKEKKRQEAEQKRLAALAQKNVEKKAIPGVKLIKSSAIPSVHVKGWSNNIPLPVRKPR